MTNQALLIDDDKITNLINRKVLKRFNPKLEVKSFTSALHAMEFLKKDYNPIHRRLIIFMDINMPKISGWEAIEILEDAFSDIDYQLFMLSSSIDERDKIKSQGYKTVNLFISKPLTPSKLEKLDLQL